MQTTGSLVANSAIARRRAAKKIIEEAKQSLPKCITKQGAHWWILDSRNFGKCKRRGCNAIYQFEPELFYMDKFIMRQLPEERIRSEGNKGGVDYEV